MPQKAFNFIEECERENMRNDDLRTKPKQYYAAIMERIKSENSAVGIDAPFTHAIIIDYLQHITARLDILEEKLRSKKSE